MRDMVLLLAAPAGLLLLGCSPESNGLHDEMLPSAAIASFSDVGT